jgi:hypothetical protein
VSGPIRFYFFIIYVKKEKKRIAGEELSGEELTVIP